MKFTVVDITVCILSFLVYMGLYKSTSQYIYRQAFEKLGRRKPLWKVYKYFSLLVSMIKIDFVLNLFFMATCVYFTYTAATLKYLLKDLLFLGIICETAYYAITAITSKNEKAYLTFCVWRVCIELVKIAKCMLVLNGIDASYQYNRQMLATLGNIKFTILVQEIISLALFIPILSLGRFIFYGFSIPELDEIFSLCISLHGGRIEQPHTPKLA